MSETNQEASPAPVQSVVRDRLGNRNLGQLMVEVDFLFEDVGRESQTFKYTLNRGRGYWQFKVVNSWHKWADEGHCHSFNNPTPTGAILDFLEYIEEHGIKVNELSD